MVLKCAGYILIALILSTDNATEGPLLTNYKSKIKKELRAIKKDKNNNFTFQNLNFELHNLEGYSLLDEHDMLGGYIFIKEVKACSLNGCLAKSKDVDSVGSEYYDISVLIDQDHVIKSVKVLDYFSDYGYQITSKKYLKKYVGKSLCDFQPESNLVDGISGATISYNALVSSLQEFCELMK